MADNKDAPSIDGFCSRNGISRAFLYLLWKRGDGPGYMQVGARRIITQEDESEWRNKMRQRSQPQVA